MRIGTAVGLAISLVAVKAALTWLALQAWGSHFEHGFLGRWHIELGNLGEWVAAFFTAGASIVALFIAGSQGRARRWEREEADLAQARLVREEISRELYAQDFTLRIHNYGAQAILDVSLDEVLWQLEPEASWKDNNELLQIVRPDRDDPAGSTFRVSFVDAEGNPVPKQLGNDTHGNPRFAETRGAPEVVYRFLDANGKEWQTGTFIDKPERLR